MRTILVIANETLGGRPLLDVVRRHAAEEETQFVLCNCPRPSLAPGIRRL